MKSVADDLRLRQIHEILALSPDERVELAFRLGDEDLETFQRASGLSREKAQKALARANQRGRRPCSFFERD